MEEGEVSPPPAGLPAGKMILTMNFHISLKLIIKRIERERET